MGLKGATQGSQDRVRQGEHQELEHMPLLGSTGGVLWGSHTKARLINAKVGFL